MSQANVPPGMVRTVALANRRASIRYRCAPATVGKVISTADHEYQLACILDLSLKGMGIQVTRPIPAGRLVMISIKGINGARPFDLTAKVVHCNEVPHDEWYVGCELLSPLTPEELEQLL